MNNTSQDKNNNNNNKKPQNQGNTPPNLMKNFVIWILFGSFIFLMYIFFQENQNQDSVITYTQYQQLLDEEKIVSAKVIKRQSNNYDFIGKLKEPITINVNGKPKDIKKFSVKLNFINSKTEDLWSSKNISWTYEVDNSSIWGPIFSILPFLLLIVAWFYLMRRFQMGGNGANNKNIFNFGRSRAKMMEKNDSNISFKDVAGADEAKEELEEIIEYLKDPFRFQRLGGKIPKGVLLLGPPGTGKTLLARAVAGEASVPFFSISGADFVEMFVGVGASRVRDLFEQAKKNSPCIVFIDEIDAVGRQRGAGLGGGHDEREQTLNQLLVEMDGFEQNSSVIIMAATNRPDVLDPALLRPGRFDRQVVVDRPDINGRKGIFKVHTRKLPLAPDINFEVLAKSTPGLSGADIANIANEAALLAARRMSDLVTMYDFEMAKDKILMGVERRSMVISDKEKELTAYHEMGHALLGKFLPHADPVHKVTIIPRGRALGVTAYLPNEESHSLSREYIVSQIIMLLGGRAAEKLVFNTYTTGASNDLQRATKLSRKMVCEWGMSEKIGPMSFNNEQHEVFLGKDFTQMKEYSDVTAQLIDSEIQSILYNASAEAERLLGENIEILHKGSKILLERETIDSEELNTIVQGGELPPISNLKIQALRNLKIQENDKDLSLIQKNDGSE
ncbi:MAG: cell division protein FtsH [Ignavibacteria bacterium GWF2_33_9]|nr:MAG: cell division protein FtsH [Ignavibacteria bacterium GWF2_33_9]